MTKGNGSDLRRLTGRRRRHGPSRVLAWIRGEMLYMGDRDSNLTSRDVSAAARAHQSGEHNGGTQSRWGGEVEHGGESRIDPFQDDFTASLYAFCFAGRRMEGGGE
jgi:hypothetical protein